MTDTRFRELDKAARQTLGKQVLTWVENGTFTARLHEKNMNINIVGTSPASYSITAEQNGKRSVIEVQGEGGGGQDSGVPALDDRAAQIYKNFNANLGGP